MGVLDLDFATPIRFCLKSVADRAETWREQGTKNGCDAMWRSGPARKSIFEKSSLFDLSSYPIRLSIPGFRSKVVLTRNEQLSVNFFAPIGECADTQSSAGPECEVAIDLPTLLEFFQREESEIKSITVLYSREDPWLEPLLKWCGAPTLEAHLRELLSHLDQNHFDANHILTARYENRQRSMQDPSNATDGEDILYLGKGVSTGLSYRESDVERLKESGLPILSSPSDVASALGLSISKLRWLAYHRESANCVHYVQKRILKHDKSFRLLMAPLHTMGMVQRWILDSILRHLPVDDACHGFVPQRSIATNAAPHVGQSVVVNLDLLDFFPSIGFPWVRSVFKTVGYSPAVATVLALLCTECPRREEKWIDETRYIAFGPRGLPQGACTSPALSNQVARHLDRRLSGLAMTFGMSYTRYADDLTFSGGETCLPQLGRLFSLIRFIVKEEGFQINEKKTRVQRRSSAQVVTGLVVNDRVGPSRKLIRRIRAILHRAKLEGLAAQNREGHANFEAWLRGQIAFIRMTRPPVGEKLLAELESLLP